MAVELYGRFPSEQWVRRHELPSKFMFRTKRLLWAMIANILLYFYAMRITNFVFPITEFLQVFLQENKLRRSYNPLRFVLGVPYVFSYWHAVRHIPDETAYISVVQGHYWDVIFGPAISDLRCMRLGPGDTHTEQEIARVAVVLKGSLSVKLHLQRIHESELVAELFQYVAQEYVEDATDWYRLVQENDNLYLEEIRDRYTQDELDVLQLEKTQNWVVTDDE